MTEIRGNETGPAMCPIVKESRGRRFPCKYPGRFQVGNQLLCGVHANQAQRPPRIKPAPPMLERDFQRHVIELAHTFHWKVAHFRTAMNARGIYMTPVGADGAGWPDLVLIHPLSRQILFRELKAEKGRLDPKQVAWGRWLTVAGCDWAMWKPSQINEIAVTLSGGRATATNKEQP